MRYAFRTFSHSPYGSSALKMQRKFSDKIVYVRFWLDFLCGIAVGYFICRIFHTSSSLRISRRGGFPILSFFGRYRGIPANVWNLLRKARKFSVLRRRIGTLFPPFHSCFRHYRDILRKSYPRPPQELPLGQFYLARRLFRTYFSQSRRHNLRPEKTRRKARGADVS